MHLAELEVDIPVFMQFQDSKSLIQVATSET
jgi:hypothetical protein